MLTTLDKIEVLKGDITKIAADVIVNAANTSLLGGGGVDGAIHRAGGKAILEECKKIVEKQGGCKTGEAVITTAGNLPARYVIHTVGPVWCGGDKKESLQLTACYENSLKLAAFYDCSTIAFPGISTGVYRFPKDLAAKIAVYAVNKFLLHSYKVEKVSFICFDNEYYNFVNAEMGSLKSRDIKL